MLRPGGDTTIQDDFKLKLGLAFRENSPAVPEKAVSGWKKYSLSGAWNIGQWRQETEASIQPPETRKGKIQR